MTQILYDARWIGNNGIGRFASEMQKAMPELVAYQSRRGPSHPLDPALLGADLWRKRPNLFFSPGYNSPLGWPGSFVFTLHDLHHLCVPEDSNAAKRAYYKYVIRPACRRAVFVLTVSEYSKREISVWAGMHNEGNVINVGNGVGLPFTSIGKKYDPGFPYLLYVGSRRPHKNLSRLLKAYSISGVGKDVRLILNDVEDKFLSAEIKGLGLTGKVFFVDLNADQDLAAVYRGAVAFVFPSLYEGFGLPPLEAMACGIPVLTSNVCALPEVVGDSALLVDPLDTEAIANGIRQLVDDPSLRAGLKENGINRAKSFSWNETARKIREILHLASAN